MESNEFLKAACRAEREGEAAAAACALLSSRAWEREFEARAALEAGWRVFAEAGMDLSRFRGLFWAAALAPSDREGGSGRPAPLLGERLKALALIQAEWPEDSPELEARMGQALLGGISPEERPTLAQAARAALEAGARIPESMERKLLAKLEAGIGIARGFAGGSREWELEALEAGAEAIREMAARREGRRIGKAAGRAAGSKSPGGL